MYFFSQNMLTKCKQIFYPYTLLTPGVRAKHFFFSESGHVAYQIKVKVGHEYNTMCGWRFSASRGLVYCIAIRHNLFNIQQYPIEASKLAVLFFRVCTGLKSP